MAATDGKGAAFDVAEKSVAELQSAMASGHITSQALVRAYVARIKLIDTSGPRINSVIELNPDALAIAAALDKERREKGSRGPMHGIPVLIKDNIATGDKMQTTAGSLALVGVKPPHDAFIVDKLRNAGAVILGKTNLSEWANFRSTRSTSGWSGRGGLTRNPYALDRNTSGSSSGSGASMAASLATVAVGTETDGSITSPCNANGLVGIKPTLGLVSRTGIVPIAHSQDTAGPMTRTVADAAALLTALAGPDPLDDITSAGASHAVDFTRFLDRGGLQGARLGVVRAQFGGRNDLASTVIESQLKELEANGAVLVDVEMPNNGKFGATELEVLYYEMKDDMAQYLKHFAPSSPFKSLQDLIDFNVKNADRELKYFGQEHFIKSAAKGGLDSKEYVDALANNHRYSRTEGIDKVMDENKLDALVAPTGAPAWITDFIRGDNSGGGFTSPAAVAGYPHITVPAGFVQGLPCGISFVGRAWSEPKLIAIAFAYEQATRRRRAPTYPKSVNASA
ncbi:Glutamyl-tRNA(Gln) amidotransferase subunit A [Usitatibacter rugosus]|uniref:Glutamyl-tRNA(Gln) amidotransferase subunit A n=1 Tax=Usitatibacter rugosus TaxID=2732067 RepID=A0A6M4GUC4_9PROT|nr:amidase [Usitatibacter rugosus]QJR10632.1 Glutamyl-tRNA(Gln) amidotransferase subunit A [Usitatibacter rugosus]